MKTGLSWSRACAELMDPTSVEGIVGAALGMKERTDARPGLPDVRVPALIIHGEDDQIIPLEAAEEMAAGFPRRGWKRSPERGTCQIWNNLGAFNRAVIEFLDKMA